MRFALVGIVVVLGLVGCDDLNSTPQRTGTVSPPGIVPVGDASVQPGSAAPATTPASPPTAAAPTSGTPATPPENPIPASPPATPISQAPVGTGSGIINQSTKDVVDAKVALQNPSIRVVENKITGSDPLMVSMTAYVSVRSKASLLGFESYLMQFKIVEERNPTYAEFIKMMRDSKVEFTALYAGQMYAYDSDKGGIVILEDSSKKR
jgi:hypothetical protein